MKKGVKVSTERREKGEGLALGHEKLAKRARLD